MQPKSLLAMGRAGLIKLAHLKHHADCAQHEAARQAWLRRLGAAAGKAADAPGAVASAPAATSTTRTVNPITGSRAVVGARTLLQTGGSFNIYGDLVEAMTEEERHGLETPYHCKRLVETDTTS